MHCPTLGCTDSDNPDYNSLANANDGSCTVLGCTDSSAVNYNPKAS